MMQNDNLLFSLFFILSRRVCYLKPFLAATNYDLDSIMQYSGDAGFKALNEFYNYVGFGETFDMTATDRIALNMLYPCQVMKKQILREFLSEETFRNYVELNQLTITPNEKSQM